jgi:hypothetical protein
MVNDSDLPENFDTPVAQSAAASQSGLTRRLALGAVAALAATPPARANAGGFGQSVPAVPGGAATDALRIVQSGPGAIARSVQDEFRDLPVSPEGWGAVGDGRTDDTTALQAALNSGRSVRLAQGKTYLIRSQLELSASGVSLSGGGRIKIARDFRIATDVDANGTHLRLLLVKAENVTISGVMFDATDAPAGSAAENGFIWSTAPFTAVRDCQFVGNPKGTCIWSLGNAPYLSVTGCRFVDCSGAVFAQGRNAVISNNIIINATDAAIAINGRSCVGAVVSGNAISNEKGASVPSMIAVEEGASNWTISGNALIGVNGGGIIATNVLDDTMAEGGVIVGNVVDGHNFAGKPSKGPHPAALISITPRYRNCIVSNNRVANCPLGNSNARLVILPATGTLFCDNIVDGAATPSLSAMISISPGSGGITIRDNRTIAAPDGRHYLFGPGNYAGAPCTFIGGALHDGKVGIDAEFKAKEITGLALHIRNIAESSVPNIVHAATALGDRAMFLNAGAWVRPHYIGEFTEMHCSTPPANPGLLPFQPGDKFYFLDPRSGGHIGVVRVAKTWKGFGAIA